MARVTIVRGTPLHRTAVGMGAAAAVAVALGLPFLASDFQLSEYTHAIAYAIALLGLNIVTGFAGQISLAHGAFFGLGAYTAAVWVGLHELPYLLALPLAGLLCFVAGLPLGIPALRLQGFHLALITLGVALAFPRLVDRWDGLTGGEGGVRVPTAALSAPSWSSLSLEQFQWYVAVTVGAIGFWVAHRLVRGRFGRALVALRDHPLSAITSGVNPSFYRSMAFAVSAAYAGVGGALFMFTARLASPEQFPYSRSFDLLAAAVVGGLLSLTGAAVGGVVAQFFPVLALWMQMRGLLWAPVAYGSLLIVCMYVARDGFVGLLWRLRDLFIEVVPAPLVPAPAGDDDHRVVDLRRHHWSVTSPGRDRRVPGPHRGGRGGR